MYGVVNKVRLQSKTQRTESNVAAQLCCLRSQRRRRDGEMTTTTKSPVSFIAFRLVRYSVCLWRHWLRYGGFFRKNPFFKVGHNYAGKGGLCKNIFCAEQNFWRLSLPLGALVALWRVFSKKSVIQRRTPLCWQGGLCHNIHCAEHIFWILGLPLAALDAL